MKTWTQIQTTTHFLPRAKGAAGLLVKFYRLDFVWLTENYYLELKHCSESEKDRPKSDLKQIFS
jgi:hypothetical protein